MLHFLRCFTQKSLIYSTDEERKLKYFSQFHKFEAKLVSPFPPICSSVCCCWVSFDFWKCLESVDKLLHFIGQATSSRFSRSQSPSSSLHTSGRYLHTIIGINIYPSQGAAVYPPQGSHRPVHCLRSGGLGLALSASLPGICVYLLYLFIYVSTCLSIYISTWLGWAGPSARCPDISTFTRQIASNRQSLAINPRLISSRPSVGENVYLSSCNVNAALTYLADTIFPRH